MSLRDTRETVEQEHNYMIFDRCVDEAERLGKPFDWIVTEFLRLSGVELHIPEPDPPVRPE